MKQIGIEELKVLQLEILQKVHDFCEANDIKYSLAYGTLLGAIRHKGYIPWDDDIDIMMVRDDYERFITLFHKTRPDYLDIMSPEINPNYYAPYANVYDRRTLLVEPNSEHFQNKGPSDNIGVKIDIFPLDYLPAKAKKYYKLLKYAHDVNSIMYCKRHKPTLSNGLFCYIKEYLIRLVFAPIKYRYFQDTLIRKVKAVEHSCMIGNVVYASNIELFSLNNMKYMDKVIFENREFYSVHDYDTVLSQLYGDYMTLPPKELQRYSHGFKAYWK